MLHFEAKISENAHMIMPAARHRVVNRYGKDRYSIAFFVYPSHSTVIKPVVDQSHGEYEPVVCGEDMLTYFRRVYPQRAAASA
jgi:isopenicillin N synthase-like dioxygenase